MPREGRRKGEGQKERERKGEKGRKRAGGKIKWTWKGGKRRIKRNENSRTEKDSKEKE